MSTSLVNQHRTCNPSTGRLGMQYYYPYIQKVNCHVSTERCIPAVPVKSCFLQIVVLVFFSIEIEMNPFLGYTVQLPKSVRPQMAGQLQGFLYPVLSVHQQPAHLQQSSQATSVSTVSSLIQVEIHQRSPCCASSLGLQPKTTCMHFTLWNIIDGATA